VTLSARFVEDVCVPVAGWIASAARGGPSPFVVAFSGTPGSGKSTLVAALRGFLERGHGLRSAGFSLDDVYYTKRERLALARDVHPLLATRGVPGTHDLALAHALLDELPRASPEHPVWLPRFDKLRDDRAPRSAFERVDVRPDVVLVDAWFWGAAPPSAESLEAPINEREALEDPDGRFRRHVRAQLAGPYRALFARAQAHVRLVSPSWETTLEWRVEQQLSLRGLAGTAPDAATRAEITRFLRLFERVARQPPELEPELTLELDEQHELLRLVHGRSEG
jgi:D-glycerate 3-kinase